jgi:pyridoxamine 5'-phosphate oxidase family protein
VSVFTETELAYIVDQPLGRLATSQPDGTLQVSPVGFTYNAELDSIDIVGYRMDRSKKFSNVSANGRVAFVIDDLASVRPWRPRCVEIRGRGQAVADSPRGALIRVLPERIISFGLDDTGTPTHLLKSNSRNVAR